jgi:hypothetical protein
MQVYPPTPSLVDPPKQIPAVYIVGYDMLKNESEVSEGGSLPNFVSVEHLSVI